LAVFLGTLAPQLITGHISELKDCRLVEDSTALESASKKPKLCAPGVGLLRDQFGKAAAAKRWAAGNGLADQLPETSWQKKRTRWSPHAAGWLRNPSARLVLR
jgi:hypothetical protein